MKPISKKFLVTAIAGISILLMSFSSFPGGDKFEIYINNKLILEQYVAMKTGPKFLTLHASNYNDKIEVFYSHCGKTGTDRKIVIRDANNKIIRKWEFANATNGNNIMSWKVREIMDLQNRKDHQDLRLFYQSNEIPQERLLATIVMANRSYAKAQ